jgi:Skp family chaperone for outer membrane proteins
MELKKMLALGCVTTCVFLLATGGVLSAAEKPEDSPKIGFIDLKNVFDEYERSKTLEKEIEQFTQAEVDKQKANQKKLDDLQKELDLVRKNSKEWFKIRMEIIRRKQELDTDEKITKVETQRRLYRASEEIYNDIMEQVAKFAREKGYTLVLKIEKREIVSDTYSEFILKVNSRGVLYYQPELDITKEIITALNAAYTGKKVDDTDKKDGEEKKEEKKEEENKEEKKEDNKEDKKKGEEKKAG